MVVLVSGCSNSYGYETQLKDEHHSVCPSYAFGAYVAKYLNAEYINIARCGHSNISIANNTIKWIEVNCIKNKKYNINDLLVLIGWTENGRFLLGKSDFCLTIGSVEDYITNNIKNTQLNKIFTKLDPSKQFISTLYKELVNREEDIVQQLFSIITVDQYLQKNKVKYFTFPTLGIKNILLYSHLLDLLSKKNNYPFAINGSLFCLSKNFGDNCLAPNKHLNRFGHVRASQWVMEQLRERKIIE